MVPAKYKIKESFGRESSVCQWQNSVRNITYAAVGNGKNDGHKCKRQEINQQASGSLGHGWHQEWLATLEHYCQNAEDVDGCCCKYQYKNCHHSIVFCLAWERCRQKTEEYTRRSTVSLQIETGFLRETRNRKINMDSRTTIVSNQRKNLNRTTGLCTAMKKLSCSTLSKLTRSWKLW